MGFDAEIDSSERSSLAENLKQEIQCAICLFILEEPMKLDCCEGHLCKKCYENVKTQFQNCPLCRQLSFTAKLSRLMVTVLSQYKLFCPAEECNESVTYEYFARHKKTCPALNKKPCPHCKKLYWKKDFQHHLSCIEELSKTNQANQKKLKDLESKNKSLTQSRNALSQNNKELKARSQEFEDTIYWLEGLQAEDSIKIENLRDTITNLRDTISFLNEEIAAAASDCKNIQNERKKVKNLEKRLYTENLQLQAARRDNARLISIKITFEKSMYNMAEELEKWKNCKFYRNLSIMSICLLILYYFRCSYLQDELDAAKQIISVLTAKLGLQPKNSGFFSGLFG